MVLPQANGAKKTRRSPKPVEFVEFSLSKGLRGRYQTVERGGNRFAEVQIHEGKAEILSGHVNLSRMPLFGGGEIPAEVQESISKAAMEFVAALRKAMPRPDKTRERVALKAQQDAQFAYVEGVLGHKAGPAEVFFMTEEQVDECRAAGEAARDAALAKHDSEMDAALQGKGE